MFKSGRDFPTTNPIVIINSERKRIRGKKAFDAYVRKQVQVGDMPYAWYQFRMNLILTEL